MDVKDSGEFYLHAGVENSNVYLLNRIKAILLSDFDICSTIQIRRREGSMKVIRGESFKMRKTSSSLMILRIEDLRKFHSSIGFSIKRKNDKLRDGLEILAIFPIRERSLAWRQTYGKTRGRWVKQILD